MEGWVCPRCKRVNAPWVKECSCWPGTAITAIWPEGHRYPSTGDPVPPLLYVIC